MPLYIERIWQILEDQRVWLGICDFDKLDDVFESMIIDGFIRDNEDFINGIVDEIWLHCSEHAGFVTKGKRDYHTKRPLQ